MDRIECGCDCVNGSKKNWAKRQDRVGNQKHDCGGKRKPRNRASEKRSYVGNGFERKNSGVRRQKLVFFSARPDQSLDRKERKMREKYVGKKQEHFARARKRI